MSLFLDSEISTAYNNSGGLLCTRNSNSASTSMPLSRLFSRRSNASASSSSRTPSIFKGASGSNNSNAGSSQSSAAGAGPSAGVNPFSSRPAPTRRPGPSPNRGGSPNDGDQPPAYADPISETADDPYAFLLKFDTVFLIDDSGSMAGRSWRETSAALAAIAPICTTRDKDGVDVHFLNHERSYCNLTSAADVERVFAGVKPMGGTPTGTRLHQLLKPYLASVEAGIEAKKEAKPMNVIVITDGVASDDVESVLLGAAKKLEAWDAPAWQLGVQFFQVGCEPGAGEALKDLDDGLVEMGCPRDIVDTVPWNKDNGDQGLSADGVLKVVLGSVNRKLDRKRNSGELKRR